MLEWVHTVRLFSEASTLTNIIHFIKEHNYWLFRNGSPRRVYHNGAISLFHHKSIMKKFTKAGKQKKSLLLEHNDA